MPTLARKHTAVVKWSSTKYLRSNLEQQFRAHSGSEARWSIDFECTVAQKHETSSFLNVLEHPVGSRGPASTKYLDAFSDMLSITY